jgi:hypothetical protein
MWKLVNYQANQLFDAAERTHSFFLRKRSHIQSRRVPRFEDEMKRKNGATLNGRYEADSTAAAMERMELYCTAHPGSPSAARRPRLFLRSHLWVALMGPSVEEGIVGIGQTVEAALRAFDAQYLAGLRPPAQALRRGLYNSRLTAA